MERGMTEHPLTFRIKEPATPAEVQLQEAVRDWRACELDDVLPGLPRDDRKVRAEFIRYLVLEGDERSFVHERGVHLDGAQIEGELDFHGCEIKRPLFLTNCRFSSTLILRDARSCTIKLDGSNISAIDAQRAKVTGSLYLHRCSVTGEIRLIDAEITGSLECHGAKMSSSTPDAPALYASRVKIGGSVFLHQGFNVRGAVSFRGATVHGNMECTSGSFSNPAGSSLSCKGLVIDGNVAMDNGFSADGMVDFTGATVHGNFLCDGGHFQKGSQPDGTALAATRARIDGSVYFRGSGAEEGAENGRKFLAEGEVNFIDAKVGGSFECHGGQFLNNGRVALWCSRISVAGSVFLHQGFVAEGEVAFRSAFIGGNLDASSARINTGSAPGKDYKWLKSLSCERSRIRGSIFLKKATVKYQIDLIDAVLGGSLECHGAHFSNPQGITLHCSRIKTGGSVFLHDGLVSNGKIVLRSAEIGGNLDVSRAQLSCEGEPELEGRELKSLCCERARIKGSAFFKHTTSKNQIDLIDSRIDGSLECHGANLATTGKVAFYCSRISIGGSVFLHDNFHASGRTVFRRAAIGGNFECDSGTFKGIEGLALDCEGIKIPGNVLMGNGFNTTGEVKLVNAEVGGYLGCAGGTFRNVRPRRQDLGAAGAKPRAGDGDESICADALKLRGATVKGNLWLGPANTPPYNQQVVMEGSLDLRDVRAGVLIDDDESWPPETVTYGSMKLRCNILLDGFTYNRIGGRNSLDLKMRRQWLNRQPRADLGSEFKTQAFEQLIRVLRDMGHTDDARAIAIYKERRRMRRPLPLGLPWWLNPVNWWRLVAYDFVAGWGYRAHRVVIAAIVIWFGCAVAYLAADQRGMVSFTTSKPEYKACQEARTRGGAAGNGVECPEFNAWKYSFDLMLPLNQLDVRSSDNVTWKFQAMESNAWAYLLNFLQHFERLSGWIAGIILVALLGRKINKD
jgi:hypothetical protein